MGGIINMSGTPVRPFVRRSARGGMGVFAHPPPRPGLRRPKMRGLMATPAHGRTPCHTVLAGCRRRAPQERSRTQQESPHNAPRGPRVPPSEVKRRRTVGLLRVPRTAVSENCTVLARAVAAPSPFSRPSRQGRPSRLGFRSAPRSVAPWPRSTPASLDALAHRVGQIH